MSNIEKLKKVISNLKASELPDAETFNLIKELSDRLESISPSKKRKRNLKSEEPLKTKPSLVEPSESDDSENIIMDL